MKTLILTLAAVLAFTAFSYQYVAAGPFSGRGPGYGCGGPGCGGNALNKEDFAAREKFYDDTRETRKKLFELRQEYGETLNAEPVDKARAEEIWSQMFDLQTDLRKQAEEQGVTLGGPRDCLGPDGYYEGDADKSSFKGKRGFGRQGARWSNT